MTTFLKSPTRNRAMACSRAAPVASLALISSWIGVEVGYIADQFAHLEIERDAYVTFVETIPYRFYPILMLLFVVWVALRGRDFGPMLRAERRALGGSDRDTDARLLAAAIDPGARAETVPPDRVVALASEWPAPE